MATLTGLLTLNAGERAVVPMMGRRSVTLHATLLNGAWGSASVAVRRAPEGYPGLALPTPVTLTADGSSGPIEYAGAALVLEVTAGSSTAGSIVRVVAVGSDMDLVPE